LYNKIVKGGKLYGKEKIKGRNQKNSKILRFI
jgi:hypothetical protein